MKRSVLTTLGCLATLALLCSCASITITSETKTDKRSVADLQKAVAANEAAAMVTLGNRHYRGEGVPQGYAEARKLYEQAEKLDNYDAVYKLGLMHEYGRTFPKDYKKAMTFYRRAADKDVPKAMNRLGHYYYRQAPEEEQNKYMAFFWYRRAAEAGLPEAMETVAAMYMSADGTKRSLRLGGKWMTAAAERGRVSAMRQLALMRLSGIGVTEHAGKAVDWLEKATKQGDIESTLLLGEMLLNGRGVKQDLPLATVYFSKAAKAGNARAIFRLGRMREKGLAYEKDLAKARRLYEMAAANGSKEAVEALKLLDEKEKERKPLTEKEEEKSQAIVIKQFLYAMMSGDSKAVKKVCVPNADLDVLTAGPNPPAGELAQYKHLASTTTLTKIRNGEPYVDLQGKSRKAVIKKDEALLQGRLGGTEKLICFKLCRQGAVWLVDASDFIKQMK